MLGLVGWRAHEREDVCPDLGNFGVVVEGRALVNLEVVAGDVVEEDGEACVRQLRPGSEGTACDDESASVR